MDEYGSFRNTPEDLQELADHFVRQNRNIVFQFSGDQFGALIINLNGSFSKHGIMSYGGNPYGRIWVSIYMRGANHFAWGTEKNYIEEKLGVRGEEAQWVADLLNGIGQRIGEL